MTKGEGPKEQLSDEAVVKIGLKVYVVAQSVLAVASRRELRLTVVRLGEMLAEARQVLKAERGPSPADVFKSRIRGLEHEIALAGATLEFRSRVCGILGIDRDLSPQELVKQGRLPGPKPRRSLWRPGDELTS